MSRRRIAFGVGLLASALGSAAVAQQPAGLIGQSGAYPVGSPVAQPMNANVATYQPGARPPMVGPVGYAHPAYAPQAACNECGAGGAACGQEPSAFWTTTYRNARWPMPFRAQDVCSVTQHFEIQRENGWRMHNTVGHAMFDPQTNRLTQAGRNHVQSILRDNPSNRKVVFVLQGLNQQQTATRVQSTELAISELLPVGDLPPVYVTDRDAPGSSGAYQAAVNRALMTSVPAPRLPAQGGAGGSSSGSGSPGGSTP